MTSFPLMCLRRLRSLRRIAAPFLVVLLGAVLGAAGMAILDPFGWHAPLNYPSLAGHDGVHGGLDDQAVFNRLEPSVVDVTAVLRYDNETAEGTGFVFDGPRGLILTNNHVIRNATSVTASVPSTGKTYRAAIVGTDASADVAVLRIAGAPPMPAAPVGNSSQVRLGDPVLAIGNQAGQGGPPTIAPGIINSLGRTIEASDGSSGLTETLRGMLQTSAQVEPGDSGGPLANAAGEVIGMDTAASTGVTTAGYAIPVRAALAIARKISRGGLAPGIILGTGGFLGVLVVPADFTAPQPSPGTAQPAAAQPAAAQAEAALSRSTCLATRAEATVPESVAPVPSGALVEGVLCGTPAAATGLSPGDVIIGVAGRDVASPSELAASVNGCSPGTELPVTWVTVAGATRTALIQVSAAPAP